jgi:hypothetical protein
LNFVGFACLFQYMLASASPSFLSSDSGNMSFLLINQRSDYAFGLFSGGKDNVGSHLILQHSMDGTTFGGLILP